jgi:hypothetical protein
MHPTSDASQTPLEHVHAIRLDHLGALTTAHLIFRPRRTLHALEGQRGDLAEHPRATPYTVVLDSEAVLGH